MNVVEWFWRGAALAEWRRSQPLSGDDSRELAARSKSTADLARAATATGERTAEAVACELYRQAVYWALCALTPADDAALGDSAAVWASLDEESLLPLASSETERQLLRTRLATGDFVTFAALLPAEQAACCAAFHDLQAALLARFERSQSGLMQLREQRVLRLGGVLLGVLLPLASVYLVRAELHRDLADGAAWRASSVGAGGCSSPAQECPGNGAFFFHTADTDWDPWVEFDLQGSPAVSKVTVENRDDCCAERAVPLVIEVSDDQQHWRSVSEREQPFAKWTAHFPTVHARWLRLRLLHRALFHLKRVKIFR